MEDEILNLKYIYSKLKYNSFKGGRYIQQSNYGQQNCGIFIGYEEHQGRLIKCTLTHHNIIDTVKIITTISIGNAGIFKSENVGNQEALLKISVPLVDAIPSLLHGPSIK